MSDDDQKPSSHEIVVDSDWMSAVFMAGVLFFSVLLAVAEFRAFLQGHLRPASYHTVFLAAVMTYMAVSINDKLFRAGATALALGAGIRALAYYFHASPPIQQLAGINDLICSLFAGIIMSVWAVQWFRSVLHLGEKQNPSE
jgi:hypothetical protein